MVDIFAAQRPFRNLMAISQLRNWVLRVRNGTHVPGGCFAAAKISTTWRLILRNFALGISQLGSPLRNGLFNLWNFFAGWPHFHNLIFQLAKFSQVKKIPLFFSFFGSLWLPSTSFEIPPDFDHSKSLSYIKIK